MSTDESRACRQVVLHVTCQALLHVNNVTLAAGAPTGGGVNFR